METATINMTAIINHMVRSLDIIFTLFSEVFVFTLGAEVGPPVCLLM